MKKLFGKCIAACLIMDLAFGFGPGAIVLAQDDWGDFDASAPIPTYDMPAYQEPTPSYSEPPPSSYPEPSYETQPFPEPSYGTPAPAAPAPAAPAPAQQAPSYPEPSPYSEPSYAPDPYATEPSEPTSGGDYTYDDAFDDYTAKVDAASEGFIKVIRHKRKQQSEFQDAVIEGLQVSTERGVTPDEVIVTCYFIFRDKPTSYFYEANRKERKITFEFVDARTGSSPIAALEQAPIKEIVIEEDQSDANKDIKGLTAEWHDVIRVSFELEHLPVIAVSNEQNIISFSYKWTTDPDKITQYLDTAKFPLVFWVSGGTLGGIGIGVLTYFLIPKKEKIISNHLSDNDLPARKR